MGDPVIEAKNLTVRYKDVLALDSLSFDAAPGDVIGIIGPNGSGKTTAVECLEGLRRPTSGTVRIFELDPWTDRKRVQQKMGVQLQETDYPGRLRVDEVCSLFSAQYPRSTNWQELLQKMGLWERKRSRVRQLSGGEKQRLSILLALLGNPDLLIFDELTTGLDPEARRDIRAQLETLRESGRTIVLVSHYLDEVERLANRILFLLRGKVRFWGTTDEFRALAPDDLKGASLEEIYLDALQREVMV